MRRVLALAQAFWLALLIAEPASLHACAMHASGHSTHASAAVADAAADEHAHHDAQHHADANTESAPVDDASTTHCQCLGECCAAAVAAMPSASVEPAVLVHVAAVVATEYRAAVALRAPDLQLPFANAPPGPLTV